MRTGGSNPSLSATLLIFIQSFQLLDFYDFPHFWGIYGVRGDSRGDFVAQKSILTMNYRDYIVRKNASSSFFFFIRIPKDLRPYFGRNQFKISLKNGIRSESILYAKILFPQVQSIFDDIRMGSIAKITITQIKEILKGKIDRTLRYSQHEVTDTNTYVKSEVEKKIKETENEELLLRSQIEDNYGGVLEHIEGEIERLLKSKNLTIDTKSLEFKKLRKQFLDLRLIRNNWKKELLEDSSKSVEEFKKEIYKRFDIKLDSISREEIIENIPKNSEIISTTDKSQRNSDDSPKLSEVKDEFISERILSGFSAKSTAEVKSTINDFIEIVGDIQISQVTPNHAREFKNIISKLPKHRTQTPKYAGLTIKQILEIDNVVGQEPKNINKLIYRVRIFFKWCKNNYSEYVPRNYFEGLSVDIKNFSKPRDGFTIQELKKIFDRNNFLNNTIRKNANKIKLPKYFVPIIGITTGMRLDEISQLRLEDVVTDGEYDVIKVRTSDQTKLKNNQSERDIPIHNILRDLGFLDYCAYLRRKKKERIFWELSKSRDGYGRNVGRNFGEYLKQIGVYEFQSKVFHSLRHSFITNLLQNGVREEVVNGIDGHKQNTMTTTVYFKGGFPAKVLYEEGISKLDFEGLNLEKLKIDWKKINE